MTFKNKLKNHSLYPWLAILLCSFFLFYKFILQVYPGLITGELMRDFNVHGAGLGNLVATYFYSYMIMQFFVGVLIDRYGVRLLASLALFVSAIGLYWFAHADHISCAIIGRLLMGLGVAFATVSYMKIAAVWFPANRFAFISGLLATAAMLGAIFGQAPLALMMRRTGWRSSLADWAIVGVVFALLFALFVYDKSSPSKTHKMTFASTVKNVFMNKQNWLLTLYSGLAYSPIAVFGGLWGHPFIQQAYHLKPTEAASLITLAFFGLAIGGPLLGALADRKMSKRKVMMAGSGLSFITLLIILYIPNLPLMLLGALLLLFGLGTGAFMLGFAVGRLMNPLALAATVIALINSGDALFGAFTEPMIGKFLDWQWDGKMVNHAPFYTLHDYRIAMLTLPVYLLLALTLLRWIKEKPSV